MQTYLHSIRHQLDRSPGKELFFYIIILRGWEDGKVFAVQLQGPCSDPQHTHTKPAMAMCTSSLRQRQVDP